MELQLSSIAAELEAFQEDLQIAQNQQWQRDYVVNREEDAVFWSIKTANKLAAEFKKLGLEVHSEKVTEHEFEYAYAKYLSSEFLFSSLC